MNRLFAFVGVGSVIAIMGSSAFGCSDDEAAPAKGGIKDGGGDGSGGTTGGTGAVGGSGGTGGLVVTDLGKACTTDAECSRGDGLICLTQVANRTIPGGICTKPCEFRNAADPTCTALNRRSMCYAFSSRTTDRYCLEPCDIAGADCGRGRLDVLCIPVNVDSDNDPTTADIEAGLCRPLCSSNAECDAIYCDYVSGLCHTEPDVGSKPIGAQCDPLATADECKDSFCDFVSVDSDEGQCFAYCSGAQGSCGWSGTGTPDAYCFSVQGFGTGAIGFCDATCSCDDDCDALFPGYICRRLSGIPGRAGYCAPANPDAGFATGVACSDAGTGGSGGAAGAGTGGTGTGGAAGASTGGVAGASAGGADGGT